MKHSIFALPALLRPALLLAAASQSTFSVHDDLLAFPQFEVKFSEDFVSESQAQLRLRNNDKLSQHGDEAPPSEIEHYRPIDTHIHSEGTDKDEIKVSYIHMVLDSQPYLCSIPQVSKPEPKSSTNDTLSKAEEERELARATDRGWELLQGMQGNCVYYISGWWSYRFCYGEGVRQFHQLPPSKGVPVFPPVEDPGVEGYTLGIYNDTGTKDGSVDGGSVKGVQMTKDSSELATKEKRSKSFGSGNLVQRGESRYLVQKLDGGTKCDLTGKSRKVEIQFHCYEHPSDRITLIKEISTCTYLMVIQTPRLCNDVAFLPPQKDQPNTISCSPILAPEQEEDYKHDLQLLREAKVWESDPEAAKIFLGAEDMPQIVGDVIVGAHAIVPEGVKLEKSAIVGGGKETYVDTIASSAGKALSKEELEQLGLGDPKLLEKVRKQLEQMAQGGKWKLDVVDTPRGREYRGIIGADEKEEEGEKRKDGEDKGRGKKKKEKEKKQDSGPEDGQGEDGNLEGSKEEYFREEL